MSWTPPVKYLKKKELLDKERFFRLLGMKSKFVDRDLAFIFYIGLVELIGAELRINKFIRLPHLGDFALTEQKSRPAWMGKMHAVIGNREILKFYPKKHLRRYFGKRQGFPRYSEILPPRAIE